MNEVLHQWYLDGAVLRPNSDFLREHVTALSNFQDEATIQLHFSDNHTVTFAHAQLSVSPWKDLHVFTHINVDTSSEAFDTVRQFLYCTPIDLTVIPGPLLKAAWGWSLYDLYNACFLVAETIPLTIIELVNKYAPIIRLTPVPDRFKCYFGGRIAIDAAEFCEWTRTARKDGDGNWMRMLVQLALREGKIYNAIRTAMRLYSDIDVHEVLPQPQCSSSEEKDEKNEFALIWRVPLAELLASGQEYVETELSTQDVSACMEVTWNAGGAGGTRVGLVVGVQRLETCGAVSVNAAVIGLPCVCADKKHNTGWKLNGGVEERSEDWVTSHEVAFVVFDETGLKEWRNKHRNCGLLIKVSVRVFCDEEEAEKERAKEEEEEAEGDWSYEPPVL